MSGARAGDRTREGVLADGTKYLSAVPERWNGTLLVYSYGPPVTPEGPAWPVDGPVVQALLGRGFAIAGCQTTRFWPLEENVGNQFAVADVFADAVGTPERTLAFGQSIGGLLSAALVQARPERLDGALVICGTLGGGVGTHNQQLDCTFAFSTLVAPQAPIELVHITHPPRNVGRAVAALEEAQRSAQGRARIALAATLASIPGWFDPAAPAPADPAARERGQYAWLRDPDLMVFLGARAILEERGGGNPSWNDGVDYHRLFASSAGAQDTQALYAAAGLDLGADLDALQRAPRIRADPGAVAYFEEHIAFTGDLGGTPVVTLHTLGDGLVPVDHVGSYADVVAWAGQGELLATLYTARGGHCACTTAETLTAFDVLVSRVDDGRWPDLDPDRLNARTRAHLSDAAHRLPPTVGALAPSAGRSPVPPRFVAYEAPPMLRAHDVRHARRA